jgi:transposase
MFLRETVIEKKSGVYRYWRLVKTYWDKKQKKVRHKTVAQLGRLKPEEIAFFKDALAGKAGERFSWEYLTVRKSLDYLAPALLHRMWNYWEMDDVIPEEVTEILAINRCLCPRSDYQVSQWYEETILPRILGVTVNPTKIYRSLDRIYYLEMEIQKHLYKKITELGLDEYDLIFYDLTSTYFEESHCPLVRFGHSRDHRRDKRQIVLALAVTRKGFPFYWQVYSGNTTDSKTVKSFIAELKDHFKVGKPCLVMDKGLVTVLNLERVEAEKLYYVVTLRRDSIGKIKDIPWDYLKTINEDNVERKKDYFIYHSKRAYYRELKPEMGRRHILCFNPEKFVQERADRKDKIESIKAYLERKNKELLKAKGKRHREVLREELNRYLDKRAARKMFKFRLTKKERTFQINYSLVDKAIYEAGKLDGVYLIMTNLKDTSPEYIISSYRNRMEIERTFHHLKGFVEIRPVYHHNEERIKAHVVICILGYLLNNTITNLVRQKKDFEELTAQSIYGYLNTCKLVELQAGNRRRAKITMPTEEQTKLTKILGNEDLLNEESLRETLKAQR